MKVWKITPSEESIVVKRNDQTDDFIFRASEGESLRNEWKSIKLNVLRKGRHKDFPRMIPGILLLGNKSLQKIEPLINQNVEFLNVENDEMAIMVCNVITVIDCIDYERSEPTYFKSTGRLSGFDKISFYPERVKDVPIFKAPETTSTEIYVSDEFRELVLMSKLKGLQFVEVYDSEVTEEMELHAQQKYDSLLEKIEQTKGQEFSWDEAMKIVSTGMAVVSGKWKLQAGSNGNILIGELSVDGTYFWVDPIFIPPVLLNLKWHRAEGV
ncbi:hypothetical protein GZH47_09260 [Paenibacillus rhizovicinus]|uniref:Immunity MXAN-0049 protein domain-containing protein n=1 Tax=Paenibacillus rhizovicinus TaxID=2704463 RepID=A0A6C0NZA4_9BACL|nr:DUF1629 domain-containing protein [Paenibacillus rhizovicinus]QHW31023.1 hypothetical protein GZH47_09260 [Paenibacillus rhizovicinus]